MFPQICNWFANWRRKLKNAGKEPAKNTWGHLIKSYNTNARGNVEQFSICSGDSIWGEEERRSEYYERKIAADDNDNYQDSMYCDDYGGYVECGADQMLIAMDANETHLKETSRAVGRIPTEQCYQVSDCEH